MTKFRKALTLYDDYHEMMADPVRTEAYRQAIRATVKPGDIVVDLGAGLGLLSLLAIEAGAARVYAIEKGDAIQLARRIAELNGVADRIVFLAENSKDCVIDEAVDVLISETLGSFALDENTLDFTIDARRRLLRPGGRMVPNRLRPYLAPVHAPTEHEKVAFWSDVCGFDFSPAQDESLSRMSMADIDPKSLLAVPQVFADLDLATIDDAALQTKLLFPITKPGAIHGMAGWFEAELTAEIRINTSPDSATTHWRQAFFPFRQPIRVVKGDVLEVVFQVGPEAECSDNSKITYQYRCTQISSQEVSGNPGRNDPCPCGSGKKFKRCCGAK